MASTHDEAGDFMSPPVASSASFFVRWAGVFAGPCRSGTADQKRWRCTGPCGTEDHGSLVGAHCQRKLSLRRERHSQRADVQRSESRLQATRVARFAARRKRRGPI